MPATPTQPFADRAEFDEAVHDVHVAGVTYYDSDVAPMLSDSDYDNLVARIAATVALHPDWQEPGAAMGVAPGASAGPVKHSPPMLSLDKVTTNVEMAEFVRALPVCETIVEVKIDGMAVHADYRDGRLVRAATRGNGLAGDDITSQVTRDPGIAGLPVTLLRSWTGAVRGELFMSTKDFEAANEARVSAGKKLFVNPRNATAGSIRKVDRLYIAPMSFAAYAISGDELDHLDNHLERMALAKAFGFSTAAMLTIGALPADVSISCRTARDVQTVIDTIGDRRPSLSFPIDGAVVKAQSRAVRSKMGSGSNAPRWATAFKYPPDTAFSVLRDIEVSVGRTGRAGFRAIIDPVTVGGTTISAATLHNVAWIRQQGLGLGSRLAVMRAGDVIPKITAVVGERPEGIAPWEPPPNCPQCDEPWDQSSQLWRCTTPACSLVSLLTYAASRDVWDIDGLGEEIATALVESGLVTGIADLFFLTAAQISAVSYARTTGARHIGTATAEKLLAGIAAAKSQPLARHITALGIRMTGRRMGRALATHFQSLSALRAATAEELADVDGVGPEKARSIHAGLRELSDVIDKLVAASITGQIETAPVVQSSPLAGKRVVISGSVDGMNRTQAQEAAERLGATVASSVSARTDLLILGPGASVGKEVKAGQLGIDTMPAAEFAALYTELLGK
ncbi:NAD-dependent DNA ligase LigA [Amycolatopsis sp. RTGN1]|uniref:NAD-dependent DNA ligase LigA n=1 Tax=Amycolatopsis ponsaeliensis TaxID=2992142 RepID=UPI002550E71D|nr:NAD-dependent DNA ligase LigA [Amycolatopsis sp. RTGN1]